MSRTLKIVATLFVAVPLWTTAISQPLAAQEVRTTGTIVGLVFDSTTSMPLARARVAVMGTSAVAETDSTGQFRVEDVPVGEHTLTFFHPRLGELGVSGGFRSVNVSEQRIAEVLLSVPSRITILTAWCSIDPGPGSTSVGGIITDALTGVPLPRARVAAVGNRTGIRLRRAVVNETRTGPDGAFHLCNMNSAENLSLLVRFGETEIQESRILPGVNIQDVALTISEPVTITGMIVDYITKQPIRGASIRLLGSLFAAVTDSVGRFGISGVPPGKQVISVEQLGYASRIDSLTVFSNEALGLEIELSTDAIVLDPIVVSGRRQDLGILTTPGTRFSGLTEAQVDSISPRIFDIASLVRAARVPGLQVKEVLMANDFGGSQMGVCIETLRASRATTTGSSCNMVEVLVNDGPLANAPQFLMDLNPQDVARIQFISPLEAGMLYGQRGRAGVLLIYLR